MTSRWRSKAIPYYYQQNGTPPLYRLWNWEKTRRNRANQNLSYRHDEYNPAASGVRQRSVAIRPRALQLPAHRRSSRQGLPATSLRTLLLLRSQYRLPIDIIALRTGAYDDTQPVDLSQESARFQDLEALYDALREELLSSLAAGAMDLYDVPVAGSELPGRQFPTCRC